MSVDFEEPARLATPGVSTKPSAVYQTIIGLGLAKDEQGAQKVAFIVIGVCVVATLFIVFSGKGEELPAPLLPGDPGYVSPQI